MGFHHLFTFDRFKALRERSGSPSPTQNSCIYALQLAILSVYILRTKLCSALFFIVHLLFYRSKYNLVFRHFDTFFFQEQRLNFETCRLALCRFRNATNRSRQKKTRRRGGRRRKQKWLAAKAVSVVVDAACQAICLTFVCLVDYTARRC